MREGDRLIGENSDGQRFVGCTTVDGLGMLVGEGSTCITRVGRS